MSRWTLLLAGLLLVVPAPVRADQGPDPEPPPRDDLTVKLVAQKKTYRLNLGGMTATQFRQAIQNGVNLPEAPAVDLELVITNNTKNEVRVRTTGTVPRLSLTVDGPNVVEAPAPRQVRKKGATYSTLRPGQSVSIPIRTLSSRRTAAQSVRHYWTEPGEYTLSASLYTLVLGANLKGALVKGKYQYVTLKTRPIKVKVEK